jgi:hypothetical protein
MLIVNIDCLTVEFTSSGAVHLLILAVTEIAVSLWYAFGFVLRLLIEVRSMIRVTKSL